MRLSKSGIILIALLTAIIMLLVINIVLPHPQKVKIMILSQIEVEDDWKNKQYVLYYLANGSFEQANAFSLEQLDKVKQYLNSLQ